MSPAFAGLSRIQQHRLVMDVFAGEIGGLGVKAGESNYTELGAEMGIAGALVWIAWTLALLVELVRSVRRDDAPEWRLLRATVTASLAAALALALQTDVIGDPWLAYALWGEELGAMGYAGGLLVLIGVLAIATER